MKIIDLLKLVYEKKAPKIILYKYCEYEFCEENNDYRNKDGLNLFGYLFSCEDEPLNFEIEIIEDTPKKIEKILTTTVYCEFDNEEENIKKLFNLVHANEKKINEIIEQVNYLLEKSDSNEY